MDSETKTGASAQHLDSLEKQAIDLQQSDLRDDKGVILNAGSGKAQGLKTTPDGNTILVPQPSDSPEDPLNWNSIRKHVVLAIVVACSFLPDYGSVTGAVTLELQGE